MNLNCLNYLLQLVSAVHLGACFKTEQQLVTGSMLLPHALTSTNRVWHLTVTLLPHIKCHTCCFTHQSLQGTSARRQVAAAAATGAASTVPYAEAARNRLALKQQLKEAVQGIDRGIFGVQVRTTLIACSVFVLARCSQ
jgi:hypothetical protein